jgi:hypothetical protein
LPLSLSSVNDTYYHFVLCFSPAGWDNEKKISILFENLHNMKPDDSYEDKYFGG